MMLCSLVVWLWILLYLSADSSRVERLRLGGDFCFVSLGLCVDIWLHWCHWLYRWVTSDVLGGFNHLLPFASFWCFWLECFLLLLFKSQQDLCTIIMPSYVSLISRAFSIFTTVEMWNDYHRIYDVDSHPSSIDIDRVVCLCVLFSKTNNSLVLLMLSITLFSVHLVS